MWYTLPYANTFIYTPAHGGQAGGLLETGLRSSSAFTVRPARSSSPVPKASQRPRLLAASAAPIRRCATSCMPSISAVSPCSSPSRRARTPRRPSSMLGPARPCGRSCIRVHGRLASPPAGWNTRARRRGQLRPRPHAAAGQHRNHSTGPAPVAGVLEAGQALDDQPQTRPIFRKKN